MKIITTEKFIADDGAEFFSKEECEKYEKIPNTYFSYIWAPDLNECRGYYKCAVVKVRGYYNYDIAKVILLDYCYEKHGKMIVLAYGSPMLNFVINDSNIEEFIAGFHVSCGDYSYKSEQVFL